MNCSVNERYSEWLPVILLIERCPGIANKRLSFLTDILDTIPRNATTSPHVPASAIGLKRQAVAKNYKLSLGYFDDCFNVTTEKFNNLLLQRIDNIALPPGNHYDIAVIRMGQDSAVVPTAGLKIPDPACPGTISKLNNYPLTGVMTALLLKAKWLGRSAIRR